MDRARLAALVRKERVVEHDGESYRLVLPSEPDVVEVQGVFVARRDDPAGGYVAATCRAVRACLVLDGEETPSLTEDEASAVVVVTGAFSSPVGRAALELCGVRLSAADAPEEPDELPTS